MKRLLPWTVLAIFLAYVAVAMFRPVSSADGFDLAGFGRLPVLVNGRIQPIDSAARMALLQIRGTVTVPGDNKRSWQLWKRTAAIHSTEWLLETLTKPDASDARRIFRLDDGAVRAALQLPPDGTGPTYHSFGDLEPRLKDVGTQIARIAKVEPVNRTASDREWLKLRNAIVIYERLKNSLQPNSLLKSEAGGKTIAYDFAGLIAAYQTDLRTRLEAAGARAHGKQEALDKTTEDRMRSFVQPYAGVSRAAMLALVPPSDSPRAQDRWKNVGTVLVESARTGVLPAPVSLFAHMSTAFATGKADVFNQQVASYYEWLSASGLRAEVSRAKTEAFYNNFQPFVRSVAVYVIVLLLGGASMLSRSTVLHRSAVMLLVPAAMLHVIGILFDMMLQGAPPVTNFYSGIIAAGGMAVLFGAAVERVCRNGIGLGAAALAGLGTIVAAHSVAPGGAIALTIAVLDTPFWIATTVMAIVIYFATHPAAWPRWFSRRHRARARKLQPVA